ncbi:MAG TPA: cobyrinate a,c-diamide synthase [Methylophilaceae bacterium]|nr:cobyrinate a,c-diamide synthase [Methylophilaceae bacterium]
MPGISCPALLLSAPASGQGKTLASAALARAWRDRGLRVQMFKCGPDFIDPMILEVASGHPVYNLDLGMCGETDARERLYRAAQTSDIILIEGVMGLFDGQPSSADIAIRFGIPVALTIDASAMAQTFGALAAGLLGHDPAIQPAGAIANNIGSVGHAEFLQSSLPAHIPWLGALPKDTRYHLPERHLGLYLRHEIADLEARIALAAKTLTANAKLALPEQVPFHAETLPAMPRLLDGKTIAVARDEAFCFLYPANLDCLQALGARLKFFSPLHDSALPEAEAVWLPGGYPELHMSALSANQGMRDSLRRALAGGMPMLAECGGMMALSASIDDKPAFGLLPGKSRIETKLQGIGTQTVELEGGRLHAHTFHHGIFDTSLPPWQTADSPYGNGEAIYRSGSLRASFLHFYFPSNPAVAAGFFL